MAKPTLSIALRADLASGKPFLSRLRKRLIAAHAILKPALADLSVALVGDRVMGDLHARFMGIPGPTDVLTFPLETDRRGRVTAGEVVVCLTEARRRAREHRTRLEHELLLYALHGMLHLCGYDDRTQPAYATMHRTEDEILNRLGIGPVFARPADARLKQLSRRGRERPQARPAARGAGGQAR
jgi:probable rRNA maturation factor